MATGESGRGYLVPRVAGTAALATALVTGIAVGTASGATGRPVAAHAHVTASATAPGYRMALMRAAAREFRVPAGLLLAVSYNQARGERQGGAPTTQAAGRYADDVYATLRRGASLTTTDGQVLKLVPAPRVRPDRAGLSRLGLGAAPAAASSTPVDCPSTLNCAFVPAAYAQDSSDPSNYGNYDMAGRPDQMLAPGGQPASMKINYIIIHDAEGSYDGTISTFQNPASYVSANYVVRSSDGAVTEMVRPHDVSWGAGDWYINMHAINIENEGFAGQGSTWYTHAEYRSDAALVQYLAAKYGIPLDRQHILGHEDVPRPTHYYTSIHHCDPAPFCNVQHFMALVHGVSDSTEQASGGSLTQGTHQLVTIDPTFATNKPTVTGCSGGRCVTLPTPPASLLHPPPRPR